MVIIGEKINGTIPDVQKAIEERNENFIRDLARRQVEAGADYIDVCAGTTPDVEFEILKWLMDIVQDTIDKPLCIDSPNPAIIEQVFNYAHQPGIINSVSGEGSKCEIIYPLIQESQWQVIALTCDSRGIPADVQTRIDIAKSLVEKAQKYDIKPEQIYIDPLVVALATDNQSVRKFIETLKAIKQLYPDIKTTSGLSNISFGMPLRKTINHAFLTVAIFAGMDSAIMDPCNKETRTALLAAEAIAGKDKYCRNFLNAYRRGLIGPSKDQSSFSSAQ